MRHKVLGSVFVLAVALGVLSVSVRTPLKPVQLPTSRTVEQMLPQFNVDGATVARALEHKESLARPMSSFTIRTNDVPGGKSFWNAAYKATVTESGFRFASKEYALELGAPKLRQGSTQLEFGKGQVRNPEHGVSEIDRGGMVEKYVFENGRAEQIFTLPRAAGSGALELRLPVTSELPGSVVVHHPIDESFKDVQFANGGLAFTDGMGSTWLAYHSAIAIDAEGRRESIAPRFENKEIVLPVSADFMSHATYPVMVDPWFDLAGSGSGGGITNNGSVSDRPSMILTGAGLPYITWSDTSNAPAGTQLSDIYMTAWTGFQFIAFSTSLAPGGITGTVGRATNPSICFSALHGLPMIAWQSNSNGFTGIFCKAIDPDSGSWVDFGGSGTAQIGKLVGPSQHPSVQSMIAIIPNPSGPDKLVEVPIVAYDDVTTFSEIRVMVFYPGQTDVDPGWYQFTPGGINTRPDSPSIAGDPSFVAFGTNGSNEYPSMVIDDLGNPVVAWSGTANGNYEIYAMRYQLNTDTSVNRFSFAREFIVIPGFTSGTFDVVSPSAVAVGTWVGIGTSGTLGGISATGGLSRFPSLAFDTFGGTPNLTVAWQESLPVAPPATTTQIYLKRSVNGGAWAELAGSASGLGISSAAPLAINPAVGGNAINPSLGVGGGYLCVAWADDSSGNFEIYARRFSVIAGNVSTQWEQVGYQGSAFPLLGADVNAPPDGISKTPNLSLSPCCAVDVFGNPTVAWMDGANSKFDILLKQFSPNGPGVANGTNFTITMRQTLDDPNLVPATTDIAVGDQTTNTTVYLSARVFTETLLPATQGLYIEVELAPDDSGFTGTGTLSALIKQPDSPTATNGFYAVVPFTGLPAQNYKWQCRTVDDQARHSPWFVAPMSGGVAFRVVPINNGGGGGGGGTPTPPTFVTTTKSRGACGLLGLEALLALGLIRILRRRTR